jgi:hypothetical protein
MAPSIDTRPFDDRGSATVALALVLASLVVIAGMSMTMQPATYTGQDVYSSRYRLEVSSCG